MNLYFLVRRLKGLPAPRLFIFDGAEMTIYGINTDDFGDGFLNGQGSGAGHGDGDNAGLGAPGTGPRGNGYGDSAMIEWGRHSN